MKRFCAAIAMACVSAVVLGAQQTAPDRPRNDANDDDNKGKVTVTGCVQPDNAMPSTTGTSGSTSTASGSATTSSRMASFILTNATVSESSSTSTTGATTGSTSTATPPSTSTPPTSTQPTNPPTSTTPPSTTGTSGTSTSATAGTTASTGISYRLDGSNLARYVGKRVEVKGEIDRTGTMSSSPSSSPSTTTAGSTMVSAAHLKVSEVREIGDCPR